MKVQSLPSTSSFNRVQFDTFKTKAGLNRFIMTPSKWIEHQN